MYCTFYINSYLRQILLILPIINTNTGNITSNTFPCCCCCMSQTTSCLVYPGCLYTPTHPVVVRSRSMLSWSGPVVTCPTGRCILDNEPAPLKAILLSYHHVYNIMYILILTRKYTGCHMCSRQKHVLMVGVSWTVLLNRTH